MKKLLLITAFLFAFVAQSKATLVINNANCDINVWAFCYDYSCGTCCIASETRYEVPAHSQRNVPNCSSGCTSFVVHWGATPCAGGTGAAVANPNCQGCYVYPQFATLPGCACGSVLVNASIPGQLTIN